MTRVANINNEEERGERRGGWIRGRKLSVKLSCQL